MGTFLFCFIKEIFILLFKNPFRSFLLLLPFLPVLEKVYKLFSMSWFSHRSSGDLVVERNAGRTDFRAEFDIVSFNRPPFMAHVVITLVLNLSCLNGLSLSRMLHHVLLVLNCKILDRCSI